MFRQIIAIASAVPVASALAVLLGISPSAQAEQSLGSATLSRAVYHDVGKGPPIQRLLAHRYPGPEKRRPGVPASQSQTRTVEPQAISDRAYSPVPNYAQRPLATSPHPVAYRYPYNYRYYNYGPRHYPFGAGPYQYNYGGYNSLYGYGGWGVFGTSPDFALPGNDYAYPNNAYVLPPAYGSPLNYDPYNGPFSGNWVR